MSINTVRNYLVSMVQTMRTQGIKKAWTIYRWHLLLAIFAYYLIRDTLMYVLVPFLIYKLL